VRDRRAGDSHDAVAGEFVDQALEALHPCGEDLEEGRRDLRLLFWIEVLGDIH
jgi:hypothetical protein